jgi:hypothetical protein
MDLTVTLPLTGAHDGHFMVTVTVIDRTAWVSYFLATMKAMALMTMNCGCVLEIGGTSQLRRPLPLQPNQTNPTRGARVPYLCDL